jgi:DNA modification methylase
LATWDEGVLSRLLDELRNAESLDGVGFSDTDIDTMLAELGAQTGLDDLDDYPAPEPMDDAVTEKGDVWLLGDHRLLCGDSSKREDLVRLLKGNRIHLVNTDPPYNVKVEPRSNNAIAAGLSSHKGTHHQGLDLARRPGASKPTSKLRAKDRPLANDFMSDDDFDDILRLWFANLAFAMEPGAAFYIWGGYANLGNYPSALKENGLYFSQGIVWNKLHPVLTRKDFMGAFELAFYGWKEGAGHKYYGPNNATDLWDVKKVNPQSMVHLTEKPCELAVRAIQYSSQRDQNVLDLFGGSGSTLMACETTGRNGFLMELDESYCDVIIRRFEQHTGKTAVHEATGKSFAELSEIREVKVEKEEAHAGEES